MSTRSEAPQQPLMLREINTRLERRPCPSCAAQNVFLTHTVINSDARRHVECRICSMRGPVRTSEAEAVEAWNKLPRDTEMDRFPVTLGKVSSAIDSYVDALVARAHGGVAVEHAFDAICQAMGRSPIQEMDARNRARGR